MSWSIGGRVATCIVLAAFAGRQASAQGAGQARSGVTRAAAAAAEACAIAVPCNRPSAVVTLHTARDVEPGLGAAERRRWAPVASLLLPGTGQALLRQDRFVAYLALEAWSLLEFSNQRTEARRQQARYRSLARDVARALYGPNSPVGSWAYYEAMEHHLESGVFDRLPGGDVDPDIDESTFNGLTWLRARTTYWNDPALAPPVSSAEYRHALNYYLDRAVRPEYRWSWRNAQLEQDLYIRTIRRSNTSFRGARAALGAVLANHLLSAVDAFITLRVEGLDGGAERGGFAVRGTLPFR